MNKEEIIKNLKDIYEELEWVDYGEKNISVDCYGCCHHTSDQHEELQKKLNEVVKALVG